MKVNDCEFSVIIIVTYVLGTSLVLLIFEFNRQHMPVTSGWWLSKYTSKQWVVIVKIYQ